jgi:hypothetical protein
LAVRAAAALRAAVARRSLVNGVGGASVRAERTGARAHEMAAE